MSRDPIGGFLGRAFWGLIGYRVGKERERERDTVLREREELRHKMQLERERIRHEAARERTQLVRLNDERATAIANRVFTRLFDYLCTVNVGTKSQKFLLKDILGEKELASFSQEVAEWVRRELRQQP